MILQIEMPGLVYRRAVEVAERERISLDQFITLAVASQVAVLEARDSLVERAKRGNWADFDRIMAKVPNVEPEPHDRL